VTWVCAWCFRFETLFIHPGAQRIRESPFSTLAISYSALRLVEVWLHLLSACDCSLFGIPQLSPVILHQLYSELPGHRFEPRLFASRSWFQHSVPPNPLPARLFRAPPDLQLQLRSVQSLTFIYPWWSASLESSSTSTPSSRTPLRSSQDFDSLLLLSYLAGRVALRLDSFPSG
jgi:hypothetical protein